MNSGCKICGGRTDVAFTLDVLGRYPTDYLRCRVCGFISTTDPHWLPEAYASAISDVDLGLVNRAVSSAPLIERVLLGLLDHTAPCVDYGAGYGILVRLMRDRGYDFHWQDRYAENLFAKGHEWDAGAHYELLTAFEVFEHLPEPVAEVEAMLRLSDTLLFSTEIVPTDVGPDWWYFGPHHGQHIAFYTREAFTALADRLGVWVLHYGESIHLITKRPVSQRAFALAARGGPLSTMGLAALRRARRVGSLLDADAAAANRLLIEQQATEAPGRP
jgi:hypothetical protein